jgi:putative hydrolase of the HAD superfamily
LLRNPFWPREAAEELGIKPEEAIFVDDNESNLEVAEEFGMIPILIDVYNSQKLKSKYPIINSISELIEKY